MSTKIYNAYRVKKSRDLWPLLRDIRRIAEANVRRMINEFYDDVHKDISTKSPLYKAARKRGLNPYEARESVTRKVVHRGYRIQSTTMERTLFNFDASVTVREHKGRYYLITYADWFSPVGKCFEFLREDPRLEDYHYQNQCDRPKEISARAWKAREKVWDAIDEAGWWDYLSLIICDWDNFRRIDPWLDRVREYYQEKARKKTRSKKK